MSGRPILGLDAGGTKTLAALTDRSGRILRWTTGPGLDPTAAGDWRSAFADILRRLDPGPVSAAALGMPFHGEIPAVSADQSAIATKLIEGPVQVMNDVAVAFAGALGGADGVLVLSGTGSMAWARGPAGEVRVGGWGPLIGDEGSAYDLGRSALRLTCQHLDGRADARVLADAVQARLGLSGAGLIGWASSPAATRESVAALATDAGRLADAGDAAAQGLIRDAAGHLVRLGLTAARRARLAGNVRWSYAGGMFRSATLRRLVADGMKTAPSPQRLTPLGGALLLAAQIAEWDVTDKWIAALAESERAAAGAAEEELL